MKSIQPEKLGKTIELIAVSSHNLDDFQDETLDNVEQDNDFQDPNLKIVSVCNPTPAVHTTFIVSQGLHHFFLLILAIYFFNGKSSFVSYMQNHIFAKLVYILLFAVSIFLSFTVRNNPGYLEAIVPKEQKECNLDSNSPKLYCKDCKFVQPIRTRHCRHCRKCVAMFDHHCFWIGGCVGEHNRGRFYLFLFVQIIFTIYNLVFAISGIHQEYFVKDWFMNNGTAIALTIILSIILSVFVFKFILQTYFLLTNQTAWEYFSRRSITYLKSLPGKALPFSSGREGVKGLLKDFFFVLNLGKYKNQYHVWHFSTLEGEEQPFNYFDNEYYDCGC